MEVKKGSCRKQYRRLDEFYCRSSIRSEFRRSMVIYDTGGRQRRMFLLCKRDGESYASKHRIIFLRRTGMRLPTLRFTNMDLLLIQMRRSGLLRENMANVNLCIFSHLILRSQTEDTSRFSRPVWYINLNP